MQPPGWPPRCPPSPFHVSLGGAAASWGRGGWWWCGCCLSLLHRGLSYIMVLASILSPAGRGWFVPTAGGPKPTHPLSLWCVWANGIWLPPPPRPQIDISLNLLLYFSSFACVSRTPPAPTCLISGLRFSIILPWEDNETREKCLNDIPENFVRRSQVTEGKFVVGILSRAGALVLLGWEVGWQPCLTYESKLLFSAGGAVVDVRR